MTTADGRARRLDVFAQVGADLRLVIGAGPDLSEYTLRAWVQTQTGDTLDDLVFASAAIVATMDHASAATTGIVAVFAAADIAGLAEGRHWLVVEESVTGQVWTVGRFRPSRTGGSAAARVDVPVVLGGVQVSLGLLVVASSGGGLPAGTAGQVPQIGSDGETYETKTPNTADGLVRLDGSALVPEILIPGSIARDSEVAAAVAAAGSASQRYGLASPERVTVTPTGEDPVAVFDTGVHDDYEVREPGQVIEDPVTGQWIHTYTARRAVDGFACVMARLSSDGGATWTAHPENPIAPLRADVRFGALMNSEDPYLAKDYSGTLHRDADGRAWLYTEEKDGSTHVGVSAWQSAPNLLTGWTYVGQALDVGTTGAWDATDRSSPVVVHDGDTHLVMMFEGRGAGQAGQVGIARSADGGATFVADPDPILVQTATGWASESLVVDDVLKVGDTWVLVCHGYDGADYTVGRFVTRDDPHDWAAGSFTELPGNPIVAWTSTLMCWGTDPTRGVVIHQSDGNPGLADRVDSVWIVPAHIDVEELTGRVGVVEAAAVALDGRLDTAESTLAGAVADVDTLETAVTDVTARVVVIEGDYYIETEARVAVSAAAFGGDALDGASDLDPAGGITIVPGASLTSFMGAIWPYPTAPPVVGADLVGVRLPAVEVTASSGIDDTLLVLQVNAGAAAVAGTGVAPGWEGSDTAMAVQVDGGTPGYVVPVGANDATFMFDVPAAGGEGGGAFPPGLIVTLIPAGATPVLPDSIELAAPRWLWRVGAADLVDLVDVAAAPSNHVKRWGTTLDRLPGVMLQGTSTAVAAPGSANWIYTHAFLPEAVTVDAVIFDLASAFDADIQWCVGYTPVDNDGQPSGTRVVLGSGTITAPVSAGTRQVIPFTAAEIPAGRFAHFAGFITTSTGNKYVRAFPAFGLEGGHSLPTNQASTAAVQMFTAAHGGSLTPATPMPSWSASTGGFPNLSFHRLRVATP